MCIAHEHGVRVVADGRTGVLDALANASARNKWVGLGFRERGEVSCHIPKACTTWPLPFEQVLDAVRSAKKAHLDGINFDLEDEIKV